VRVLVTEWSPAQGRPSGFGGALGVGKTFGSGRPRTKGGGGGAVAPKIKRNKLF